MPSPEHNVASWLTGHAEARPRALAVRDAERSLDYAALEGRCRRLAGVLAEAGVGPGDRVGILLANRSATVETFFAAARLGAIAVPTNNRLAPPEIARQWEDSEPRALVFEEELRQTVERAAGLSRRAPPFRLACGAPDDADDPYEGALAAAPEHAAVHPATPDDPNTLMYTSGTTGVPKGALLPHRKALYNSRNAQIFFELAPEDRVLVVVPLFHSFGLNILALPVLYVGAALVLQPRFEPAALWRAVTEQGIHFFGGVPTMFRALLEELERAPGRYRLDGLRFAFTAGSAIDVELIRAFEARGLVLKQGFGQTETSILCCLDAKDALRKAGSVGRPITHGEVRVVRIPDDATPPEDWRDVEPGEAGEIVVRGPITMLRYWNQPEETAHTLRGEWLRTGDLARVDAEGFVTLEGRMRDMYISGGENVYPAEVEAMLVEHPDIREAAVVGEPDPRWGEVGCAYLVTRDGRPLDAEALAAWARERMARFKIPRRVVCVDALPRTVTGKVQKHRLAETERSA